MKIEQVPQDAGKLDGEKELCYAVDEKGNYVTVQSSGWRAKNITLDQAWDYIKEQVDEARKQIQAGKQSNLAYFMAINQMDIKLLASYSGFSRWKIKKHLKPKHFNQLDSEILKQYASIFRVPVDQLKAEPGNL